MRRFLCDWSKQEACIVIHPRGMTRGVSRAMNIMIYAVAMRHFQDTQINYYTYDTV